MDPISLATSVMAALAPYAVKGGEAVAAELGKKTVAGGAKVLKALWTRWRGDPDREARLKAFVEGAEGGSEELKLAILADLTSHPTFADTLSGLLANEIPKTSIEQIAEDVENMTGAEVAEMIRGNITIKQNVKQVKSLTGLRVGTFGAPSKKTSSD
jgi:hypothetical protein